MKNIKSRAAYLVKLALKESNEKAGNSKVGNPPDTGECVNEPQPGCSSWNITLQNVSTEKNSDSAESGKDFIPSESS